jgi:hypothetical protein
LLITNHLYHSKLTYTYFITVEYVKRANNGWKILGDGVFAREPEDLVPENLEGGDEANSALSVKQATRALSEADIDE